MWNKTVESKEIIVFEKHLKDYKLKIEARKNGPTWEVFKTKISENSSDLISEHVLEDKNHVIKLIEKLKNDNKITPLKKHINVTLNRVYKEEFFEKWFFKVNDEELKNFIIIKFDSKINVDVVIHEKYSFSENQIINQIEDFLGLRELGDSIKYEIYYFKKHTQESQKPIDTEYIEVDFLDEDYY